MKILVANDDGIQAAGIRALVEILAKEHELYVVAPNQERSAMGHALTLHKPLRLEKLPEGYFAGVDHAYTIDGTPADCVKIALNKVLDFKPDMVISGINHGPNLGSDIVYSGTVSAAMEGCIYGIKSIAFSLNDMKDDHYEEDAKAVPQVIEYIESLNIEWPEKTFFNVNLPSLKNGPAKGILPATLGARMYTDDYDQRVDPRGRYYYWLSGDLVKSDVDLESDVIRSREGYISVTPISLDFLDQGLLSQMKK